MVSVLFHEQAPCLPFNMAVFIFCRALFMITEAICLARAWLSTAHYILTNHSNTSSASEVSPDPDWLPHQKLMRTIVQWHSFEGAGDGDFEANL